MAIDTTKPFRVSDAMAQGMTRGELRGRAYVSLLRGVQVSSDVDVDVWTRVRAALLVHPPGAVITHHTAAELQRLPAPRADTVHLSVRRASDRRRHPGISPHVGRPGHTVSVGDVPVSTGSSLFRELAHYLVLTELVALGDALVHRGLATTDDLLAVSSTGSRTHEGASWVRPRVESSMETRLRMLLVLAGFPEPEVNASLDGGRIRVDLCWPRLRLAVEYDGQHHRQDLNQWHRDLRRREWLEAHGWTLLVFISRDLFQAPEETIARTYAAWTRAGGTAFAVSDAWRAHFPTRA